MSYSVSARWVFPVSSPPLENGIVVINGEFIEAVLPAGSRTPDEHLGNFAIIPGLVNAHTHLDLSGARGQIPPDPNASFTEWLKRVIQFRRTRTLDQVKHDIRDGLQESLRAGVTLVGDISNVQLEEDLPEVGPEVVQFGELLGLSQERADAAYQQAEKWLNRPGNSRRGLSPHAPYSVREKLLIQAGQLCRVHRVPLAMHLAESIDEMELLTNRTGPMVDFLKELGVYDPTGLVNSPQEAMDAVNAGQPKLFIHCNHLPLDTVFPPNSSVVICPRTFMAFNCELPEHVIGLIEKGVNVALGTDSLASSPDLDLFVEMFFLWEYSSGIGPEHFLQAATLNGAKALGLDHLFGSLEAGKIASLVAMELEEHQHSAEPQYQLMDCDLMQPRRVMVKGRWVTGLGERPA